MRRNTQTVGRVWTGQGLRVQKKAATFRSRLLVKAFDLQAFSFFFKGLKKWYQRPDSNRHTR